jgi:hypothetical protein
MTDPLNKNMLSPVGFDFSIRKTPDMHFFIQSIVLPGITLGTFDIPNPLKKVPMYGDHIEYGELEVTFKINEDMTNYLEIFDWITAIGFPDNYGQHKAIRDVTDASGEGIFSDATLTILSSAMNPNIQITITDLFPLSLSPITLDTRDTNIDYIEATASFRFQNYTFKSV